MTGEEQKLINFLNNLILKKTVCSTPCVVFEALRWNANFVIQSLNEMLVGQTNIRTLFLACAVFS